MNKLTQGKNVCLDQWQSTNHVIYGSTDSSIIDCLVAN